MHQIIPHELLYTSPDVSLDAEIGYSIEGNFEDDVHHLLYPQEDGFVAHTTYLFHPEVLPLFVSGI